MRNMDKMTLYFLGDQEYATSMIELLPALNQSEPTVTDLLEFTSAGELSTQANDLVNYAIRKGRNPYTKQSVKDSFEAAFQLIGGVPRLALWADKNPTQFFTLYAKLLPAATSVELTLPSCPKELEGLTAGQLKQLVLQHVAA